LHLIMAILSGNKIYPLIMNSFADLYFKLRGQFFASEEHRDEARSFYRELLQAVTKKDARRAEAVTRAAMELRLEQFKRQAAESPAAPDDAGCGSILPGGFFDTAIGAT